MPATTREESLKSCWDPNPRSAALVWLSAPAHAAGTLLCSMATTSASCFLSFIAAMRSKMGWRGFSPFFSIPLSSMQAAQ